MERLTYKFNSLSLANFAANTIKKDGVGVVLSNNNGFIVVETADAASVQEIANSARGYEVLREATPTMPQQKPVGMVRPANPVVARLVNYKVPMFLVKQYPVLKKKKDSMPGSRIMWSHTSGDNDLDVISAKEVDSYLKDGWVIIEQLGNGEWQVETLTEKKKLTPDQLKKVNTSLRAKMTAKKDGKKEEVEEEGFVGEKLIGKQHKLDFNKDGKLTGKDFEILKTIRKQKAKKEEVEVNENTGLMTNLHHPKGKAVLNKSGKIVAIYKTERAARKHASTGKPVKEEVEEEMTEAFRFRQQDWENMRSKYKSGTPVNITLKSGKTVSGTLLRMDKYDQGVATKGHLLHVKTAKGNVKIDDVNVKGIQWNNDPKTKMSEEVEAIDELSKKTLGSYVKKAAKDIEDLSSDAEFYLRHRIGSNSQYQQFDKTRAKIRQRHAGVGKAVKRLTKEEPDITEAAPTIKAGMRLYAKQDKKTDNGSVVKGQYYKVAAAGNGLFDLIHQSVGYRKAMHKVTASAIQAMIQNKVF